LTAFSEDLDFDCKGLSREEFLQMTGDVLQFLRRSGLNTEIRKDENPKLKGFQEKYLISRNYFSKWAYQAIKANGF
jgi:hypothetical protein